MLPGRACSACPRSDFKSGENANFRDCRFSSASAFSCAPQAGGVRGYEYVPHRAEPRTPWGFRTWCVGSVQGARLLSSKFAASC